MGSKRVVIIGGGVGGLATACLLGKAGYRATVLEKNEQLGGRAGQLRAQGFTFDTGPSWYLMPDVFERFFAELGERVKNHMQLVRLSPSYRVFYKGSGQQLDITGNRAADMASFEAIEPGAGQQLQRYLERAAQTYHISMHHFLYKNYGHAGGVLSPAMLRTASKLPLFGTVASHSARFFRDPRLQKIVQYPAVFLGASPFQAPALYSLLSHTDFTQGVFYPMGGMYELVQALVRIGKTHGVRYETNTPVEKIIVRKGKAVGVLAEGAELHADIVVSNADMHHTETQLLPPSLRSHSARYWHTRTVAPSALLLYLGVNRRLGSLTHHNLLFSENWRQNFAEIFGSARFPADPSLYICAPSKTDPSVAPRGCENLFVLVPVAAGLEYTQAQLAAFTNSVLETLETELHIPRLRQYIVYQHAFCVDDFTTHFNSFRGSGLGLSHTLLQTAMFRPRNQSRKVRGLYYVGATVHPGIGLPSTLISAHLLAKRLAA